MPMTWPKRENSLLILWDIMVGFIRSSVASLVLFVRTLLGHRTHNLHSNAFLSTLDFILQTGPRAFWRRPTGIKIGRGLSTLVHFVFFRETSFQKKK